MVTDMVDYEARLKKARVIAAEVATFLNGNAHFGSNCKILFEINQGIKDGGLLLQERYCCVDVELKVNEDDTVNCIKCKIFTQPDIGICLHPNGGTAYYDLELWSWYFAERVICQANNTYKCSWLLDLFNKPMRGGPITS